MNAARSNKEALRDALRLRRQEISPEQYAVRSAEIARHLIDILRPFKTILVSSSKPPDVDTQPLIEALLEEGRQIIVQ